MIDFELNAPQKLASDSGPKNLFGHARRCSLGVLLAFIGLSLTACGNAKKIVTSDNSADYRAAVSLPPLKKPSRASQSPTLVENQSSVEKAAESITPDPQTQNDVAVQTSIGQAQPEPKVSRGPVFPEEATSVVQAQVITPNEQAARLQIKSGFASAWAYLQDNLKKSDVTVYSRNESAGRISIGCADVDEAPVVETRGGWSILTKKKNEELEYCALQAISTKGTTLVTVLNRTGQEVGKDYAMQIFQRILNN